jgi:hypothetical protein
MLDGSEGIKTIPPAMARDNSEPIGFLPAVADHAAINNVASENPLHDYSMSSPSMRVELASLRTGKSGHGQLDSSLKYSPPPKDAILVDPNSLKTDEETPLDLKDSSSDSVYPGAEISKLSTPELSSNTRIVNHLTDKDTPKPLELVKDMNPALYDAIKNKVKNPTYIGEVGDITVPTYDKKGKQIGCTVIKNTPYWLSDDAAHSYLKAKEELAQKHIDLSIDSTNGAGRTLEQEKGIDIRNPGRHAPINHSLHGSGNAADLTELPEGQKQLSDIPEVRKRLHENGFRQGDDSGPIGDDLHHWSYTGPGPATEGHPPVHHKQASRRHHGR